MKTTPKNNIVQPSTRSVVCAHRHSIFWGGLLLPFCDVAIRVGDKIEREGRMGSHVLVTHRRRQRPLLQLTFRSVQLHIGAGKVMGCGTSVDTITAEENADSAKVSIVIQLKNLTFVFYIYTSFVTYAEHHRRTENLPALRRLRKKSTPHHHELGRWAEFRFTRGLLLILNNSAVLAFLTLSSSYL